MPARSTPISSTASYWALPFFAGTGLMSYRKDLLDAAGFDVPETWAEMLEVAAAIKTDDAAAIALRAVPGQGFNMFIFPMIMRAYGGKFFADYLTATSRPAINSPENLEALNVYIELINEYGPRGAGNFNFAEVNGAAQNGQSRVRRRHRRSSPDRRPGQEPVCSSTWPSPRRPDGPAGRSPAIAVHGLGIPASAPNPDASSKFIEWAVSAETLTKIALAQAVPGLHHRLGRGEPRGHREVCGDPPGLPDAAGADAGPRDRTLPAAAAAMAGDRRRDRRARQRRLNGLDVPGGRAWPPPKRRCATSWASKPPAWSDPAGSTCRVLFVEVSPG